jgi:hypothetical protein
MSLKDLYAEINSLQLQIENNEGKFDIALQSPGQLGYARQIYRDIKFLEGKLADLIILLNQKPEPG